MKNAFRFYFTLCALLLAKTISAQLTFSSPSLGGQYFFTNYSVDDGLSNGYVRTIAKDNSGFIWVGTEAGLNRFNGYDFTVYKSRAGDSTTIPSNVINHLFVDSKGTLWISTFIGVCVYDTKNNNFKRIPCLLDNGKSQPTFEPFFVTEDSKKNIWACSSGLGLLKYDSAKNSFVQFRIAHNDSVNSVLKNNPGVGSLLEDRDGVLWVSGRTQLFELNPENGRVKVFKSKISGKSFQPGKFFMDYNDENFLWLSTWGNGLVRFNKKNGECIPHIFQQNTTVNLGNIVFDVHHRDSNTLWLATNMGVAVFNVKSKMFSGFVRDSLNEKTIVNRQAHSIFRDNDGIVWFGTVAGLCNLNPLKQGFVSHPVWAPSNATNFFEDTASEKIYGVRIYHERTLIIYDRKTMSTEIFPIPDADRLMAEPFSVIKDSRGLIWIGTTKGVFTFDETEKKFTRFHISDRLTITDRPVYSTEVHEDNEGNIWIADFSRGLFCFNPAANAIRFLPAEATDENGLRISGPNRIINGTGNTIFIAGNGNGVAKYDAGKNVFENYYSGDEKYFMLAGATDIAYDRSKDWLWVTTKNSGLVLLDKNRNTEIFLKDDFGNFVDEQYSIVMDDSGIIWVSATNGLYRFNPVTKSFTLYSSHDGLPVRTIDQPLYKMADGSIAFHFHKGIFSFYPGELLKRETIYHTHLTSFSVNGKAASFSGIADELDTIRLSHTENNFTVEFAATNFTNPEAAKYSYRLEGNDNGWSVPSRTRVINFSQLSPGVYWLRIRAGENSPEKKLFIQIIPAWWQTNWFKWLAAIFIVAILFYSIRFFLSFRYRQKIAALERQREIENIRMRISRDIHDEIGSGLTKIKLMSRNLTRASADTKTMKETSVKISSASDELIQNLSEIVWTVNPANDTLENVFAFTRNYLSKLFEENPEVKLNLDFPEPHSIPKDILINPEVKRNLLLILKEAVTNIFKHAHASDVTISLHADKSKIELRISDNGIGIANLLLGRGQGEAFGNGLKNMRKRTESINAQLTIESPEQGTVIKLLVPLMQS